MLRGREVARVGGIDAVRSVEAITGEVVKGADLLGGWLAGTQGNESTEDGGRETGRLV
jgi:hypothetical protein